MPFAARGVFTMTVYTLTAGSAADLNAELTLIDVGGADAGAGNSYTVTLTQGFTLDRQLYAINLQGGTGGGDTLTIDGGGATLDGANTYNGFFVYSGAVAINDLTIANAVASGGIGDNSGGGGAGLGGGLFVAGTGNVDGSGAALATGGAVTLSNVAFIGDAAKGGAEAGRASGNGGGGGLGGRGGTGGGGVGLGATGSVNNGGAGIVLGAAPGGVGSGGLGGPNGGGGAGDGGGGVGGAGRLGGFGGGGGSSGNGGLGVGGFGGGGAAGANGGFGGGGGLYGSGGFGGGFGVGGGDHGGGGGLGAGADVFVQQGGVLTIAASTLGVGTVAGGGNLVSPGGDGQAYGSGLFIQGNDTVTLAPGAGQALTIAGTIADQTGSGGTGANAGAGALAVAGGARGTVTLSAANTYSGGTTLSGGTLDLAAPDTMANGAVVSGAAGTGAVTFAGTPGNRATLALDAAAQPASGFTFGHTLTNFGADDAIDVKGFTYTASDVVHYDPFTDLLTVANGTSAESFALQNPTQTGFVISSDGNGGTIITDPVCFAAGTLIRTVSGDVTVEDLAVGDLAVTASGEHRPIRWLGSRTVDCRSHPDPAKAQPIRIARDAFGPGKPSRDLLVSPEHSLCVTCVEEVLIPAVALLNGATVAYADLDTVTYWHVELDSHDILFANDLPAESFLEMGANRGFFGARGGANGSEVPAEALARTHADFCRPFVDGGPVLAFARDQLAARAARLGWTPSCAVTIAGDADGRPLRPVVIGGEALFSFAAETAALRVRSDLFAPATIGGADPRRVGLAVYGLTVVSPGGATRTLDLDNPALRPCFHDGERRDALHYRWTAGDLVVPASLYAGTEGPLLLRLAFEPTTVRGWTAPPQTATAVDTTVETATEAPTRAARPKLRAVAS